jgi:hypothetical protein
VSHSLEIYRGLSMEAWIERRTQNWDKRQRESVQDWGPDQWRSCRQIIDEFGEFWPTLNGVKGDVIVQRFLAEQPKVKRHGLEYTAPYSLGLHLAALRRAREQSTTEVPF